MLKRWTEMVPAMRVHIVILFVCMVVCLVGIVLTVVKAPTLGVVLLLLAAFVGNIVSTVVAVMVGRRQEIDAAVQRGRRWDEEHGTAE